MIMKIIKKIKCLHCNSEIEGEKCQMCLWKSSDSGEFCTFQFNQRGRL